MATKTTKPKKTIASEQNLPLALYQLLDTKAIDPDIKLRNPAFQFADKTKHHEYDDLTNEDFSALLDATSSYARLWDGAPAISFGKLIYNAYERCDKDTAIRIIAAALDAMPNKKASHIENEKVITELRLE